MFRRFQLKPVMPETGELEFEWNPDIGALRGRDAARVEQLVEDALAAGTVTGHPFPTPFDVIDPLHNVGELAVVLGQFWHLQEDLSRAYPKAPEDETPANAVY